jgi:hypothetical protein
MHTGRRPIGNPDPAARELSPVTPEPPLSDRVCDAVVLAFAAWTVCCHAIVAAGGGLVALLYLYAVVLIAGLWLCRKSMPRPAPGPESGPDEPGGAGGPIIWVLRLAVLAAALVTAVSFAARPDVLRLWWSSVIVLGLAAAVYCLRETPQIVTAERGRWSEMLLWMLAAAAVVVTLISHRPDDDDAFYVNVAAAAADAPGRALLSEDTMHGISGLPLHLPIYRVHSYELFNGAVSYLTGIPPLYSFHWLSASLAALLIPLAHARLFRILTPRWWLATVATLVFILIAVGETHRWYGNFAFVRLWQGKSIFLSVFLPLVYAYALRFAARPNLGHWIMLTAAQIAAVGCNSSALWVAPASAAMALCAAVRPSLQGVKTLIVGTLCSAYVLAAAWLAKASVEGVFNFAGLGGGGTVESGPLLSWAMVTVLGDGRVLIVAIVALLAAWVFAPTALARRFAIIVPLAAFVGLLNPYIAAWVRVNVTGPSYWRSLWALPVPIMMALLLTSPLYLWRGSSRPALRRATWIVALALFALLIPHFSGLSAANGVRVGWPTLKVPDAAYDWAIAVNESVPPGSHVAVPTDIGTWIVTRRHHAYPLMVRSYLRPWRDRLTPEEFSRRLAMQRLLDNPELVEASSEQFRDGLDRFAVRAVCMANSPKAAAARTVLQQANFHPTLRREDFELWVRSDAGPNPRG